MGTTALTEAVFYILLSLDAPLHGYGIMRMWKLEPVGACALPQARSTARSRR